MSASGVTFSWGDLEADRCGFARTGTADGSATALGVAFAAREPAATSSEPGAISVESAGDGWALRWSGVADLRVEPVAPPAELTADEPAARAGGMTGSEQLCHFTGSVLGAAVDCLGQRGVQSGSPNWETIGSARAVSAWLDPEHAVALTTIRPAGARGHDEEAVWGALLAPDPVRIDDPRLSTTWDAEGRQRGASLELWVGDEDPWAERAAGQVYCGSSMDLGALRLDCAFFTWRMDGHKGLGRYDVLRRT